MELILNLIVLWFVMIGVRLGICYGGHSDVPPKITAISLFAGIGFAMSMVPCLILTAIFWPEILTT